MTKKSLFTVMLVLALVLGFMAVSSCDTGLNEYEDPGASLTVLSNNSLLSSNDETWLTAPSDNYSLLSSSNDEVYSKATSLATQSAFQEAGKILAGLTNQPYYRALSFIGTAINIALMFLPSEETIIEKKLDAIHEQLNEIQETLYNIQVQINLNAIYTNDNFTALELSNYMSKVSDAIADVYYFNNNGINLSRAHDIFMAIDGKIQTGDLAELNNEWANHIACQNLYSSGIDGLNTAQMALYNSYVRLANIIIGTNNEWTTHLSAADTYEYYLSKIFNYNTQTFEARQAFLDSMYETFSVLTMYMLRAAIYDQEYCKGIHDSYLEIADDPDPLAYSQSERDKARYIAVAAWVNYLYDKNTFLDPDPESGNKKSITYFSTLVVNSLKNSQDKLRKEETLAKISVTGDMISTSNKETYNNITIITPLIYSYRLGTYLCKNLTQVPMERYGLSLSNSYSICGKERGGFRNLTTEQQNAINNELKEYAMTTLKNAAEYRSTNIINDLINANFIFNFVLQTKKPAGTYYILGLGGLDSRSDNYKVYVKSIIWDHSNNAGPPSVYWSFQGKGSFSYSKTLIQSINATEKYESNSDGMTAIGLSNFSNIIVLDPDIISYGDINSIPDAIKLKSPPKT